jgi:hypothetical protein
MDKVVTPKPELASVAQTANLPKPPQIPLWLPRLIRRYCLNSNNASTAAYDCSWPIITLIGARPWSTFSKLISHRKSSKGILRKASIPPSLLYDPLSSYPLHALTRNAWMTSAKGTTLKRNIVRAQTLRVSLVYNSFLSINFLSSSPRRL